MADPYASFSVPAGPAADPYAAISRPAPAASADVMGGGVQDWEPSQQPETGIWHDVNHAVNRFGTNAIKAATGFAGTARGFSDLTGQIGQSLGLTPEDIRSVNRTSALTTLAANSPSAQDYNNVIFKQAGLPEVQGHTPLGKMADSATQFALAGVAGPGNALRNMIPSAVAGAGSEALGQATEGTKFEPWARLLGAVVPGGLAALIQNGAGSVLQAIRNLKPDIDETAAKIIARGIIRDKTTAPEMGNALADLGPGAPVVEAGGPNVRGVMRGAIAAPGEARTTAQNVFDARMQKMPDITTNALDKNISPNSSLGTTLEDITALQKQQAQPAYQAAGIPARPERLPQFAIDEPTPGWNTPTVSTPGLEKLYQDSTDIRGAINAVRGLPDYKELPYNSMSMWDKAYKRLGDMEQSARQAGKPTRANDIMNLRKDFLGELTADDAAPKYQKALDAFSGPQKIKDAAERGKEWFTKNVDPALVTREFQAMSPAEQQAAKEIGARDWAREIVASRSGRGPGDIANRTLLQQGQDRARLQAILSPQEFADIEKQMGIVQNALATNRDINVGSRTAPLLAEQADNAGGVGANALADAARGRWGSATMKGIEAVGTRMGSGRTEAVNAKIAEMLSSTDPQKVGLVNALAERARLAELTKRSGRRNALAYGGLVSPGRSALVGADQ